MPNGIFRKGLVLGVICLLMLFSPVIPAFSVQDRNNEELVNNQGDALPDLVIVDVYYRYDILVQDGWFTFESVQTFAHRIADLSTNMIKLKTHRPTDFEVNVPISELWKYLYCKVLYLQFCHCSSFFQNFD